MIADLSCSFCNFLARRVERCGGLFVRSSPRYIWLMANWTIQSLIERKMTVTAYCHASACGHHQVLDLEKLRERLGPDAPAMAADLEPKLVCSKCRGKKLGLIYAPDDKKVFGMGKVESNLYAKAKGG